MSAIATQNYDRIGTTYAATRAADPRIAQQINTALGNAVSVVNVGAGTGAYEPLDRSVVAVEPSATMIRQRQPGHATRVRAAAEALPLADDSVGAALATLTIHHWLDPMQGLAEMRRVATGRVVVLTWDQEVFESFWLVRDYLPCIRDFDRPRAVAIDEIAAALGATETLAVPVPHDCADGFLGALWRRPAAYLDPRVRAGISACVDLPEAECEAGLLRLAADIETGAWAERYPDVLALEEFDAGYRLVVADLQHAPSR